MDKAETIKDFKRFLSNNREKLLDISVADYGYTEEEIKEVIEDLNSIDENGKPKYKGMED